MKTLQIIIAFIVFIILSIDVQAQEWNTGNKECTPEKFQAILENYRVNPNMIGNELTEYFRNKQFPVLQEAAKRKYERRVEEQKQSRAMEMKKFKNACDLEAQDPVVIIKFNYLVQTLTYLKIEKMRLDNPDFKVKKNYLGKPQSLKEQLKEFNDVEEYLNIDRYEIFEPGFIR